MSTIDKEAWVRNYISSEGLTGVISTLNDRINSSSLNTLERKLMSDTVVYADCLYYAFETESVNNQDVNGIYNAVMRRLGVLSLAFYKELIIEVLDSRGITLPTGTTYADNLIATMVSMVASANVPITAGAAAQPILDIYDQVMSEGPIRHFVTLYIEKAEDISNGVFAELDRDSISESMIDSMVDYLGSMKLNIPDPSNMPNAIANQTFDEYFALALDYALKVESGGVDPIDLYRIKGSQNTWDFSVDLFDSQSKQGIVAKNIIGAGAVNYIYVLGEQLGCFDLAEALILEWARGAIYITDPATESKMYRYYKLLEERANSEERGMLYKRVLNLGEAQLLQGTIVNQTFTKLWSSLMEEIVSYITKTETSNNRELVSRLPIIQLIHELQYNLTSFFTGMAHIQTTEMYNHLQDALEIMGAEDVMNQVIPGRSRNVWSVLDVMHQNKFGTSPNITAYKTAAVEGYKLFQFISNFNESTVTKNEFNSFIVSAESYILALSQDSTIEDSPSKLSSRDEFAGVEEEFEDWDA